MKKHFRILAAALALCLSVLCSPQTVCRQCAEHRLQTVCGSGADHLHQQKDGRNGLDSHARRQEIPQKIDLQQYEGPGKGYPVQSKGKGLYGLQKVLLRTIPPFSAPAGSHWQGRFCSRT